MNPETKKLIDEINTISKTPINIMEVCGTHTMSIARSGIRSVLPGTVNIISGPGCPVCVTSAKDLNTAIELAKDHNNIITTFGDMLKVPVDNDSLQKYKNVKIIYNPLDSLKLAKENPDKKIIFIGIGFETTAPLTAATILRAENMKLDNFYVLSICKTIPQAVHAILSGKNNKINSLILPGHVSAVTGYSYFDFILNYGVSGVVSSFEAENILTSILILIIAHEQKKAVIENNYANLVSKNGNPKAISTLYQVFENSDSDWRGIGTIPGTGLKIRDKFSKFDATKHFYINNKDIKDPEGCLCGTVLMGKVKPTDCSHFAKSCTPANPVGPCMVSSEGTCAAFFKYLN